MKKLRQRTLHPASGDPHAALRATLSHPIGEGHLPRAEKECDGIAASERYLDKVAVAKRLGVKPKTVAEWANQEKLPAYRLGPYLRFKWAEVESHLAAACQLKRGGLNGESRHFTPAVFPIEAERERKPTDKSTNPALSRGAATTKGNQ